MGTCIAVKHLEFRWPGAPSSLLTIPSLTIARGERVLLRGASGSGKSTLLSLIAGVHQAPAGQLEVLGHDLGRLSQHRRDQLRANEIGYIFQQFNLLPFLNAEENVTLASQFAPARRKRVQNPQQHAQSLLKQLGLAAADTQRLASQLSVGQQQRVAAARALFGAPSLIIADEPTSALDAEHRDEFIQVLFKACAANQTTLLFVTHDQGLAPMFERTIELSDINHARKDDGDA